MKTIKLITASLLISAFAFTSCKKETDEENNGEPKTMKVRMTDAPGDFARLEVEITEIEVYNQNDGWITLENETQVVSVLDLTNGNEIDLVSETTIKSGNYTKLRLTFGNNNKVWVNTEAFTDESFVKVEFDLELNLPNNQYEIVINQNLNAEAESDILLDFNVAESITGSVLSSFELNPEISVIKDEKTGIRGTVEGSENVAIMVEGNGKTYSGYTDNNGKFLIRGMVQGTYDVMLMPTEDDLPDTTTVEAVVVSQGEINSIETVVLAE